MGFLNNLRHAWDAFIGKGPTAKDEVNYPTISYLELGHGSNYRPDIIPLKQYNEKNIVASVNNRIAMDVASLTFNHVKLDQNKRYLSTIESGLNNCLTLEANKDQTSKAFIMDLVNSVLNEGDVAIIPIRTTKYPINNNAYDVLAIKVATINTWYPDYINVHIYNERTGNFIDMDIPKANAAIIHNPLFPVMNEPNSVGKRLARKLSLMDAIDEQMGSNKLDLIVQLPFAVRSDHQQKLVEDRRKSIETQLKNSKYGIGYIDSAEKITQLNRPVENNVMKSVEYLTSMFYSQLGITQGILDGTADEATMLNYMTRCVQPIADAIVDEIKRKFLSSTARSQGQTVMYFNEPFKLVPISKLADIADRFIRNQIMSPNEMRQVAGLKPVQDANADMLKNPNINEADGQQFASTANQPVANETVNDTSEEIEVEEDPIESLGLGSMLLKDLA